MAQTSTFRPEVLDKRLDTLRNIALRYGLTPEVNKIDDRARDARLGLLVLVAGEGNFGKSSLINGLAGREIAPVSILPKTFKVDVYRETRETEEFAELRRIGQAAATRMTLEAARDLCAAEEEALRRAEREGRTVEPQIVEVIWNLQGLEWGPEVCLVDTPGLAQFGMSSQTISRSLVRGLGATYTVDEVWALWYHRADVALWVFQANAMESRETYGTLTTLVGAFRKALIPVATKADLIPRERWPEINQRFRAIYGRLLDGRSETDLWLTVAGGRSVERGAGIVELRSSIHRMATETAKRKKVATEAFIADSATGLAKLLSKSADQLISNLRTIADTADEIALFAMEQVRRAADRIQDHVRDHFRSKEGTLDTQLASLERDAVQLNRAGRSKEDLQGWAEQRMLGYLEADLVGQIVDRSLRAVGDSGLRLCRIRVPHEAASPSKCWGERQGNA